jgi:predicted lactoylglutathione lyase
MATTTVTLDEQHFKAITKKAQEMGTTPEHLIHSLIDAATDTFDEILAPARKAFAKSGVTEDELDEAVNQARKAIHAKSRRDMGK